MNPDKVTAIAQALQDAASKMNSRQALHFCSLAMGIKLALINPDLARALYDVSLNSITAHTRPKMTPELLDKLVLSLTGELNAYADT